jgi:hypothetical protein
MAEHDAIKQNVQHRPTFKLLARADPFDLRRPAALDEGVPIFRRRHDADKHKIGERRWRLRRRAPRAARSREQRAGYDFGKAAFGRQREAGVNAFRLLRALARRLRARRSGTSRFGLDLKPKDRARQQTESRQHEPQARRAHAPGPAGLRT